MSLMAHAASTCIYGAGMSVPGGGGHASILGLGMGGAVSYVFGISDPGILGSG